MPLLLFKLTVSYDGTRFNGFQRQRTTSSLTTRPTKRPHWDSISGKRKGCPLTVQECLEMALRDLGNNIQDLNLRFAGRTDKGVHAKGQVVVVHSQDNNVDCITLRKSLNSRLPVDISIQQVVRCNNPNFCPRRGVQRKQYFYTIKYRRKVYNSATLLPICESGPQTIRSALDPSCLWLCPWALEGSEMNVLTRFLQGHHNYQAFVHKEDRAARDHVLTIDRIVFEMVSEFYDEQAPIVTGRFLFQAKSFRRSMIRNLVGFCVDVCRGREDVGNSDWIELWSGNEDIAAKIHAAPARGLCLDHVGYNNDDNLFSYSAGDGLKDCVP